MTAFDEDLKILKQKTVDKQEPLRRNFNVLRRLTRSQVEFIFDREFGHIFVTRVAGNMVSRKSSPLWNTAPPCLPRK